MRAPEEAYAVERFEQAAALLPHELREGVQRLSTAEKARAEEFRLRAGRPPMVADPTGERTVPGCGQCPITAADLTGVLEVASQASTHTVLDRVKSGFVTVRGGYRVGLCGSAVMKDGEVCNVKQISSLAIRIAREVPGAGAEVLPQLWEAGTLQSTLLLSPPGGGKTTLLRDLIRRISDGVGGPPLRVGVVDERGELAAMYNGVPMTQVGIRTDVMDGCPKAAGLMMLLRGMNPQVLAADEITAPEDVEALEQAAGCRVALLCSAHGGTPDDLRRRPLYRRLLAGGIFRQAVLIELRGGRRNYRVVPLEEGLR